jgi:hypothetical protein
MNNIFLHSITEASTEQWKTSNYEVAPRLNLSHVVHSVKFHTNAYNFTTVKNYTENHRFSVSTMKMNWPLFSLYIQSNKYHVAN